MSPADTFLKEIEKLGERKFIPVIGPKKGKILDNAIRESRARMVLEVGTLVGYSAVRIAKLLPETGRVFSIEKDPESAEIAIGNIAKAKFSDKIQIFLGDARTIIPTLRETFDLVFLDAEKSQYLEYLELAEEKLRRGSVIVADNAGVFANEMNDYLSYVRGSGKYHSKYYESTLEFNDDIKDGVEISIRL